MEKEIRKTEVLKKGYIQIPLETYRRLERYEALFNKEYVKRVRAIITLNRLDNKIKAFEQHFQEDFVYDDELPVWLILEMLEEYMEDWNDKSNKIYGKVLYRF